MESVWVVAQVQAVDAEGWATDWDLGGVFTTEDKARQACTEPGDGMWPVQLDRDLGRETVEAPAIEYPIGPPPVAGDDDPPVQCWHTEPDSPCDWNICRQPERLAAGDRGVDPADR